MPYVKQSFPLPYAMPAFLCLKRVLGVSVAEAQRLIDKGRVFYQGERVCAKNQILRDCFMLLTYVPIARGMQPLFQTEDFAVMDKPAAMLIHQKGRFSHYSLLDEVRSLFGAGANLVHRIDKETSGLVLVGKHKKSLATLGEMFFKRNVVKEYLALVRGVFPHNPFSFSLPLATQQRGGDLCVRSVYAGENLVFKTAQTSFESLGILTHNQQQYTFLKVIPQTGRTHQIRLHLEALGYPILGDPLYGTKDSYSREYLNGEFFTKGQNSPLSDVKRLEYFGAKRLMLHAYSLAFCYKNVSYCFKSIENFELKGIML